MPSFSNINLSCMRRLAGLPEAVRMMTHARSRIYRATCGGTLEANDDIHFLRNESGLKIYWIGQRGYTAFSERGDLPENNLVLTADEDNDNADDKPRAFIGDALHSAFQEGDVPYWATGAVVIRNGESVVMSLGVH